MQWVNIFSMLLSISGKLCVWPKFLAHLAPVLSANDSLCSNSWICLGDSHLTTIPHHLFPYPLDPNQRFTGAMFNLTTPLISWQIHPIGMPQPQALLSPWVGPHALFHNSHSRQSTVKSCVYYPPCIYCAFLTHAKLHADRRECSASVLFTDHTNSLSHTHTVLTLTFKSSINPLFKLILCPCVMPWPSLYHNPNPHPPIHTIRACTCEIACTPSSELCLTCAILGDPLCCMHIPSGNACHLIQILTCITVHT